MVITDNGKLPVWSSMEEARCEGSALAQWRSRAEDSIKCIRYLRF